MDHRDLDRWARLIAASCSRRRTMQVVGAGALAFGLGRRARFDALAAELGCCKCSGTLRCELDVATYGECKTLCGPRKQAIFAPNYTCTRGNSLNKVCKQKRQATGLALLAGAPGVYDLAFVDRAGAAAIPDLLQVTSAAHFTAEAAIAAGLVREPAAAVLFDGGVQVFHSLRRNADETLGVFSHVSQHLTVEAAARWYDYAVPQLSPEDAETFDFELSGIDTGMLTRFAFPSTSMPGTTITRLMAITLTGEFVNWFGIDAHDAVPDPELARTFAQGIVDALIDRPEQTTSLAPYVALLPGAAVCLPESPAAEVIQAGTIAARGAARFQVQDSDCEASTGNIRYLVWDRIHVPILGAPAETLERDQRLIEGADRMLEQSYTVGNQIVSVTIGNWWNQDAIANGGESFFARRAELDAARGAIRQDLDMPHGGASGRWFCSAFAFDAGEEWIYGVDAVSFASPYSLTFSVVQPGLPLGDPAAWVAVEDPAIIEEIWPLIERVEEAMNAVDWHELMADERRYQSLPTYASALTLSPQDDEAEDVTLITGLRDFGATTATLGMSSAFTGFTFTGGQTLLTEEAMEAALRAWADRASPDANKEEIVKLFFSEQSPVQARIDQFTTPDEDETIEVIQWQYPVPPTREAWEHAPAALGGWASAFDPSELAELSDPDRDGSGYTWQAEFQDGEDTETITYLLVVADEIVAVVTHTAESSTGFEESENWAGEVFENLVDWYDEDAWAGEVGEAVQDVAPWLPALDAQTQWYLDYYYGYVDGEPLPRFGDDPDRIVAENPWVRNALFGSYGLESGLGGMNVLFGVREFADLSAASDYLDQWPVLLPDMRPTINWLTGQPFEELAEFPHVARGGTSSATADERWIAADVAIQFGTIVFDVSAFAPYTGDEAAFADLDVFAYPTFAPLSQGLAELVRAVHDQAEQGTPSGYLPDPLGVPASWQSPVEQGGEEAAAVTQYDPVAWAGNVILALPEFEITPLVFVYDPGHESAASAFYGAEPPTGWQGMARTALFAPNPEASNGQGFDLALYLKGHWFDSADNATEWYLTGEPLLEATGNGGYVEQTGEAEFGARRTVWGASFPAADNPDITIERGIAWFRRGHVVVEATMDAHCAGAAGPGTFCAEGVVPYLIDELGALIDDGLRAANTKRTITRDLPVIEDMPVIQVDLTQWGDQAIKRFGDAAEQRERRDEFGFSASAHVSLQYIGATDASEEQVTVFGNSWVTESFIEARQILEEELVRFVEESDERIGAERTEIPMLTLSGEEWAITANGFVFPVADGTKVGGVEVRVARDTVLNTAAVVTPLPSETTALDVASELERQVEAASVCPTGQSGPTEPQPGREDLALAVLLNVTAASFGLRPADILNALATEDNDEAVEVLEAAIDQLVQPPEEELTTEAGAPQSPVGSFMEGIDEATIC